MNENKRIIEINGVKLEVDLTTARRIDEFKVGDTVKVLDSRNERNEVRTGVITEACDGDYCVGDCDLCDKEPEAEEEQMPKYINADELIKIIKTHHYMLANATNARDYGMFTIGIAQAISETESVEIVRCEDCSHYIEPYCARFITAMIPMNGNDCCSKGKPKNERTK